MKVLTSVLLREMLKKEWTCIELAEQADVTVATVRNAKKGKSVNLRTVILLANALGVPPVELGEYE